jgi:hypothetical protein
MSQAETMQGALYRNRRRRLARLLMQTKVSAWQASAVVEDGMFVTTDNGNTLLQAQSSGTTGSVAPTYPTYSDTVKWIAVSSQGLLSYQYQGIPTL